MVEMQFTRFSTFSIRSKQNAHRAFRMHKLFTRVTWICVQSFRIHFVRSDFIKDLQCQFLFSVAFVLRQLFLCFVYLACLRIPFSTQVKCKGDRNENMKNRARSHTRTHMIRIRKFAIKSNEWSFVIMRNYTRASLIDCLVRCDRKKESTRDKQTKLIYGRYSAFNCCFIIVIVNS